MNPIFVIAVVAVVVGLVGAVLAAQSGRDSQIAVGHLARESVQRDKTAAREAEADKVQPATGREVELATVAARNEIVPVSADVVPWSQPDEDAIGVSRRQFMNRGIVAGFGLGISGFAAGAIAFLWPQSTAGFGSKISVGKIAELKTKVEQNHGFLYFPEGRMWITEYPSASIDNAKKVYTDSELSGMEAGLVALYQKCPHLGCRVPSCATSQWFECPCHGSQYNRVGEKKGGPAPRGMDRFVMTVAGGVFSVDTGKIIQGPAIGINTTGQEAEGPHCVSGGH